jgi:hypothetical protein
MQKLNQKFISLISRARPPSVRQLADIFPQSGEERDGGLNKLIKKQHIKNQTAQRVRL